MFFLLLRASRLSNQTHRKIERLKKCCWLCSPVERPPDTEQRPITVYMTLSCGWRRRCESDWSPQTDPAVSDLFHLWCSNKKQKNAEASWTSRCTGPTAGAIFMHNHSSNMGNFVYFLYLLFFSLFLILILFATTCKRTNVRVCTVSQHQQTWNSSVIVGLKRKIKPQNNEK